MRDLLISLLIFGALPWIFMRPYVGALIYAWLSLMNPHRLAYGFAYSFPFGLTVALVTIVSMLFSSEKKQVPWTGTFIIWMLFVFWLNVTTFFAIMPEDAIVEWDRSMKIQFMVLITMLLLHGRHRINAFVWVMAVSLGFFGIKGGLFSVLTGGQYLVMGPKDSFITDNNTLALALIMTLPLMRYLLLQATHKYLRLALIGSMMLTTLAIITSHSRGALLAGATILVFLIMKSRHRLAFSLATIAALPAMLYFMPEAWFERMGTIGEYDQDASALGRINAWWFAFNLAVDHPLTGGGFDTFSKELFLKYAPVPLDHHDAHSIYFEILGEQGFVGLGLFLMLGLSALLSCAWVIRNVKLREDLTWARDLASMLQVSLIGYATGGAFLGLGYYDFYYNLIATVVLLRFHVQGELRKPAPAVAAPEVIAELPDKVASSRPASPARNLQRPKPFGRWPQT